MSQRWQFGSITSAVIQPMDAPSGGGGEEQSRQTTGTVMFDGPAAGTWEASVALALTRRLASNEGQE